MQSLQSTPPLPQYWSNSPARHMPVLSQQPPLHVCGPQGGVPASSGVHRAIMMLPAIVRGPQTSPEAHSELDAQSWTGPIGVAFGQGGGRQADVGWILVMQHTRLQSRHHRTQRSPSRPTQSSFLGRFRRRHLAWCPGGRCCRRTQGPRVAGRSRSIEKRPGSPWASVCFGEMEGQATNVWPATGDVQAAPGDRRRSSAATIVILSGVRDCSRTRRPPHANSSTRSI